MRSQILTGVILLLAFPTLSAQEKGNIRFFIDPGHNFEFILDGNKRMNVKNLELTTGKHSITFWAPTRAIVDTVINVQEGEQSFYLRLPYSLSYMAHERRSEKFNKKVFWQRSVPALVSVGTGVWTAFSYGKMNTANKDLNALEDSYHVETVPNEIRKLKEVAIPAAKDELASRKSSFTVAASVFAASLIGTAYAWYKTRELEAPIFDDKAKLKFDGLVYLPDTNGGMLHAGLSITFK